MEHTSAALVESRISLGPNTGAQASLAILGLLSESDSTFLGENVPAWNILLASGQ